MKRICLRTCVANIIVRHTLLLPIVLLLVACSNVAEPDEILTSLEPTVSAVSPEWAHQTSLPPSPAPLTEADYEGLALTYDEALLGTLQQASHNTAQAPGSTLPQPEHIVFSFSGSDLLHQADLRVYPLTHYKKLSRTAADHIANLRDILFNKPVQPSSPLPLFPWSETVNEFETAPVYIEFLNGYGLSFITSADYELQTGPVYVFQGLSNDDEYLITALAPLKINADVETKSSLADSRRAQVVNRSSEAIQEMAAIQHKLDTSLRSLEIDQRDLFSDPTLTSYLSFPGVLMAYDPQISGDATIYRKPPVYSLPDGESVFLSGVPDAIYITFNGHRTHDYVPRMIIQPLRGATGQYYSSIPVEQKKQVEVLETSERQASILEANKPTEVSGQPQRVEFLSGIGERTIQGLGADNYDNGQVPTYEFLGITSDGRYFISFSHPLELDGGEDTMVTNFDLASSDMLRMQVEQLDLMVQSLVINADASTDSSMPVNEPDCTRDAEFIEDLTIPDDTVLERGHAATKIWRIRNTGTCTWTPAYQIQPAGGNPITWQKPSVLDIVNPGEVTEISVEITSPEVPGNYQAWWQLADEMGNSFGPFYHVKFESPRPATEIPNHGVIEGKIGYPAGQIPAMIIYFARTDGSERYALETETGWNHYANELPAGDYYVFARVAGDESSSGGGYTAAVVCDMICEDHQLLVVTVEESKATRNVDILDWYAPAGTFPLP